MAIKEDPICIIKLDLTGCANVFGQGPCTATGVPCRNTWNTCKDKCNYVCETRPVYFSSCTPPPHFPFNAYPIIDSNSVQRSVVKPKLGQSFSTRPFVNVRLNDIADNDQELNPYADPEAIVCPTDNQGSLLGRLIASHCWFDGRGATMYTGYCSDSFGALRTERFIVDSLTAKPHRTKGSGSLKLQDPLLLAKDATCPSRTDYLVATGATGREYYSTPRLAIELTKENPDLAFGQFVLASNLLSGDPVQDAALSQVEYICIGSETMQVESCINTSAPAGWNFRLIDRAVCGSSLSDHKPGANIFPAMAFESMHIVDIVRCLLSECTSLIDVFVNCCTDERESIIDDANFEQYRCKNPLQFGPRRRLFCKPESIKKNINELELLFGFQIYTDQECGVIRIRGCEIPEPPEVIIDGCQLMSIDVSYIEDFQKMEVLHSPIDCAKKISEDNAGGFDVFVTDDAVRQPCERRESKTIKKKTIQTSWIDESNLFVLKTQGWRFTRRYRKPLRFIRMKGGPDFIEGFAQDQTIHIDHQCIQNPDGSHDITSIFSIVALIPGKKESSICAVEEAYAPDVVDCIDCATIQPPDDGCSDCQELH